jgi:hypothetical protein
MSNIEKVLTVFRGIKSRDPALTTKYMNPAGSSQSERAHSNRRAN